MSSKKIYTYLIIKKKVVTPMIDVLHVPKYQFYKKERCEFDDTPFTVIGARRGGGAEE